MGEYELSTLTRAVRLTHGLNVREDARASVFETILAELVSILSFTFFYLVNKTILTFHYCTTLIN